MKKAQGMTLIEVLIALLIIAIAMTAVIKVTGSDIRSSQYRQDKTLAYWAASSVLNERQAGAMAFPPLGETQTGEITVLNQTFPWSLKVESTSNGRINKITVTIYSRENSEHVLVSLVTYES